MADDKDKSTLQKAEDTVSDTYQKGKKAVSDYIDMAKNIFPGEAEAKGIAATQANVDEYKANTPQPDGDKKSYKKGTDYVPKTGDAKLHQGEAVLKKEDASKYRTLKTKGHNMDSLMNLAEGPMAHGDDTQPEAPKKPKKEIKSIHVRKGKNGGHVIEHHHTHPMDHPMEEHPVGSDDAMIEHMIQHGTSPNPGEAEADAGQSGIQGE